MVISKRWFLGIGALVAATASQACASQSDSFRRLSAEAHEQAVDAAPGDLGATADDHRTEARRLRSIEQAACADVPEADRDEGPLSPRTHIVALELLRERPYPKEMLQLAGVAMYLRAAPGQTEQWLDRVLECHLAHHAVVGARMPNRASPLFVDDVRIALSSTGDGFRIAITTHDEAAAREVVQRAKSLVE
ncbi:MAG: hypothetical protein ABSC94_05770 [Polyangiaceae bacterium]|jgi:hypothetical protein